MNPELILQTPAWYLFLCVILGLIFSGFMYYKTSVEQKAAKIILSVLRGLLTTLVAFLLLNPLIKSVKNVILNPKVVVAIDNSKSMQHLGKNQTEKLLDGIIQLSKNLENKGYAVDIKDINSVNYKPEDLKTTLKFDQKKTNLSGIFSNIKTEFEGQNLQDVVLVSDGILNDGVSPNYQKYNFKVNTVGFGDTTAKKDLVLVGVTANKLAYLGNKFVVGVDISANLLAGKSSIITVKNSVGGILAKKAINIKSNDDFQTISFELTADKIGKQRLIIDAQAIEGEVSTQNNHREIVIDVINGKEKILLVSSVTNPDLKAFRSIIEKNDLFEFKEIILSSSDNSVIDNEVFDILILNQLPDQANIYGGITGKLLAKMKPTFFVLGSNSNVPIFNGMQNVMGVSGNSIQLDKSRAIVNNKFSQFILEPKLTGILENLPPLLVPFGDYYPSTGTDIIVKQRIGNVSTERPLLAINLNGNRKSMVLAGEGIWQWRMQEFAETSSNIAVDELITKGLSLLSVKDQKTKLRVYPVSETFGTDQKITFKAEAYNSIFEKIYDQKISLKIKNEKGETKSYEFTETEDNDRFELSNLPKGIYSFVANANVLGKNETCNGEFVVTELDLEATNTTADFNLLKSIANENHGYFVNANNIADLSNKMQKNEAQSKIISTDELKELINQKWILFLIVIIAIAEWVYRKYLGLY